MSDDDQDETEAKSEPKAQAKDELFEAIDHFKKAANILFDKATKDPKVRTATEETGKIIKKLGDKADPIAQQLSDELSKLTHTAEPLAQQLSGELKKLTQRITDSIKEDKPTSSGDDAAAGDAADEDESAS